MSAVWRLARLFALGAGALLPSTVQADWQYTEWGMTEAEVVAASGNTALEVQGNDRKLKSYKGLEARLSAPYSSGEFDFIAYFHFDPASNELVKVSLKLLNGDAAVRLEKELRLKYGNPTDTDIVPNILTVETWLGATDEVGLAYDKSSATVSYAPRISGNNQGL